MLRAILFLMLLLSSSPAALAAPRVITDTTASTATVDGVVNSGEYPGFSDGINSCVSGDAGDCCRYSGSAIGQDSRIWIDSNASGDLNFGVVEGGACLCGEPAVMYIDAVPGGYPDTTPFDDTTGLAFWVSGIGNVDPGRADIFFAPGFEADFAILVLNTAPGTLPTYFQLWELVGPGNHILRLSDSIEHIGHDFEFSLSLSDLGLLPGGSFKYIATRGQSHDPNNPGGFFRSNQFHGVANTNELAMCPIGTNPVTLQAGDFNVFNSYIPPLPTVNWTGAGDGTSWNDPNNWDSLALPAVGEEVRITASGTYTVQLSAPASVRRLVLGGESGTQTLEVLPTLTLAEGGVIETSGAMILNSGGTVTGPGGLSVKGLLQASSVGNVLSCPFVLEAGGNLTGVSDGIQDQLEIQDQCSLQGIVTIREQFEIVLSDAGGVQEPVPLEVSGTLRLWGGTISGNRQLLVSRGVSVDGINVVSAPLLIEAGGSLSSSQNPIQDQLSILDQFAVQGYVYVYDGFDLQLSNANGIQDQVPVETGATVRLNGGTISGNREMAVSGVAEVFGGPSVITAPFSIEAEGSLVSIQDQIQDQLVIQGPFVLRGTATISKTPLNSFELQLSSANGIQDQIPVEPGATLNLFGGTISGDRQLEVFGAAVVSGRYTNVVSTPWSIEPGGSLESIQDGFLQELEIQDQFSIRGTATIQDQFELQLSDATGIQDQVPVESEATLNLFGGTVSGARILAVSGSAIVNGSSVVSAPWSIEVGGTLDSIQDQIQDQLEIQDQFSVRGTATIQDQFELQLSDATGIQDQVPVESEATLNLFGGTVTGTRALAVSGAAVVNGASIVRIPWSVEVGGSLDSIQDQIQDQLEIQDQFSVRGVATIQDQFELQLSDANGIQDQISIEAGASLNLGGGTVSGDRELSVSGVATVSASSAVTAPFSLATGSILTFLPGGSPQSGQVQNLDHSLPVGKALAALVLSGAFNHTNGAIIQGTGTLDLTAASVINGGRWRPSGSDGSGPGLLTVVGDFVQENTGVVEIDIGGVAPGTEFDRIDISGSVGLDGALLVEYAPGFDPTAGDVFNIVGSSSSPGGSFQCRSGLNAANGVFLDPVLNASGYSLHATTSDPGNAIPIAVDDQASTSEMTPVRILPLANDTDADGDPLLIVHLSTGNLVGAIAVEEGDTSFVYTPPSGYAGVDSLQYTATDCNGAAVTATIAVTVQSNLPVFTSVTEGPQSDTGWAFGASWGDYDADGDPDLYFGNSNTPNKLLRNDGGSFVDVTPAVLANPTAGIGGVWADLEGDGDLDFYQCNNGPNKLIQNDGAGTLVDATVGPLADAGNSQSATWADYDADGDLDLLVTNSGAPDALLRNDGAAGFADVSAPPLGGDGSTTETAAWADYDNDGDLDVYITGEGEWASRLLRNDSSILTLVPGLTATGRQSQWGDYDNDGDLDLFVVRGADAVGSILYRNDGQAGFTDVTPELLKNLGHDGFAVVWVDYDNDADLDLYIGNSATANRMFRNDLSSGFAEVTVSPLNDAGRCHGLATADFDGDGDLDIYVANLGTSAPNVLLRNDQTTTNHWLHVDLQGSGTNRSAIGARVRVVVDGVAQIREVSGGGGYGSQETLTAEFGLGQASVVDTVEVRWPSGATLVTTQVLVDQLISLEQLVVAAMPEHTLPGVYRLHANQPNPFNPSTIIRYELPDAGPVLLVIYDVAGRRIRTLVQSPREPAGVHSASWDGRDDAGRVVNSGVYFYRLHGTSFEQTRKMILLK